MTAATVEAATRLSDTWHNALDAAHRLGYSYGWPDGWNACEREYTAAWSVLAGRVRAHAGDPTAAELEERRRAPTEPCGMPGCSVIASCSRCIYLEHRARRGEWLGTDRGGWAR